MRLRYFVFISFSFFLFSFNSYAQTEEGKRRTAYLPLVMTYWENQSIQDAKHLRGRQQDFIDEQFGVTKKEIIKEPIQPKKPGRRSIKMGGILYRSAQDWTIWLNNQRVEPGKLPKEIIDIKVSEDYVDLRWFDEFTNNIYPIRLRANQTFNLDARIFIPG